MLEIPLRADTDHAIPNDAKCLRRKPCAWLAHSIVSWPIVLKRSLLEPAPWSGECACADLCTWRQWNQRHPCADDGTDPHCPPSTPNTLSGAVRTTFLNLESWNFVEHNAETLPIVVVVVLIGEFLGRNVCSQFKRSNWPEGLLKREATARDFERQKCARARFNAMPSITIRLERTTLPPRKREPTARITRYCGRFVWSPNHSCAWVCEHGQPWKCRPLFCQITSRVPDLRFACIRSECDCDTTNLHPRNCRYPTPIWHDDRTEHGHHRIALLKCVVLQCVFDALVRGSVTNSTHHCLEHISFRRSIIPTQVCEPEMTSMSFAIRVQPDRLVVLLARECQGSSVCRHFIKSTHQLKILVTSKRNATTDQNVSNSCARAQLSNLRSRLCLALRVRWWTAKLCQNQQIQVRGLFGWSRRKQHLYDPCWNLFSNSSLAILWLWCTFRLATHTRWTPGLGEDIVNGD